MKNIPNNFWEFEMDRIITHELDDKLSDTVTDPLENIVLDETWLAINSHDTIISKAVKDNLK